MLVFYGNFIFNKENPKKVISEIIDTSGDSVTGWYIFWIIKNELQCFVYIPVTDIKFRGFILWFSKYGKYWFNFEEIWTVNNWITVY